MAEGKGTAGCLNMQAKFKLSPTARLGSVSPKSAAWKQMLSSVASRIPLE